MNKTININLAGIIFYVDEDAYKTFSDYLQSVKAQFKNTEEGQEIIADIEARIAELLQQKLSESKQVINMADVDDVISTMGSPEDYAMDEDDETGEQERKSASKSTFNYSGPKRLYRNPDDKILSGLSSGIALYFGIDPIWVRLIWIALFFGWGTGFFLYIILWIVMPEAKTTTQKLQMRGEPINIDNIERSVRDEMKNVKQRFSGFKESSKAKTASGKVRNVVEEIVSAILSILKYVIEFIFKFMGVILMIAGVILLIIIISTLFGNSIQMHGAAIDWGSATMYLDKLFNSPTQAWLFVVGAIMLILAPIIGIILLSMRILFNYRSNSKVAGIGIVLVLVVGFILLFSTGSILLRSFASNATSTKTIELGTQHKGYALQVTDFIDNERPYELNWTITDKYQLIDEVQLDVKPTNGTEPKIEIVTESRGENKVEARQRAKNYKYFVEQKDSIINFADYFLLPSEERFRGQEMQVNVYLPVGYKVYLDRSLKGFMYDIDNVTNTYDADMLSHWWVMTQNGLACLDCTDENLEFKDDQEWESYEEQFEADAKKFENNEQRRLEEAEQKLKEAKAEIERLKKKTK